MTAAKISTQMYTCAISETLSQLRAQAAPSGQLRQRFRYTQWTQGPGQFLAGPHQRETCSAMVALSRPNYPLQQTPRETISKFQQRRSAALLNSVC